MLKPRPPQASFYGAYLYDKIVPTDHLLRRINQVVDFSFVDDMVKDRYTPDFGRPAEDPEFMLRLCLLQYLYDDSDREVEENARINLAYKYFLGMAVDEEPPDHSTLCTFRAQRLGEEKFRQVFQNIVQQCIDKGLVKGQRQIIDSTHILADITINSLSGLVALCRQNVLRDIEEQNPRLAEKLGNKEPQYTKQDKFAKKEEQLEKAVSKAKSLMEQVTGELDRGNIEVTPALVKDLELLEKAAVTDREDEATDRLVSPVDPEARNGKKTNQSWAGYKGHMIIEEDSEIITAVETTPANQADGEQCQPLLKQQEKEFSLTPSELSGDKGYDSGANLEYLDGKGITGYISLSQKNHPSGLDLFKRDDFNHDPVKNTLTCPAGYSVKASGREMVFREKQPRKGFIFQFTRKQCGSCELRPLCFIGNVNVHGRNVRINYYDPFYQRMKERMESEAGKEIYRNRYKIEHKVADLARYCGMRRCRYRGLIKAKIHTLLSAIASNVKRMARLLITNSLFSAGEVRPKKEKVSLNMLATC
jgi:transposase